METVVIKYNPQNSIVLSCLEFLSTLKGVKILSKTEDKSKSELNSKDEKKLFFAGSQRSMSKHIEKYLI